MRNVIKTVTFALLAFTTAAPIVLTAQPVSAKEKVVKLDKKKIATHLREHQTYPATKAELVTTCQDLMDFSSEEKA